MENQTGLENSYIIKYNKKMRYGYTTGSCAAAAAKAATEMLLGKKEIAKIELMTPKGILLKLLPEDILCQPDFVRCAIRKDGGDDPDATNQMLIYAEVSLRSDKKIVVDGGEGIGRVTRKGLSQKVGEAAINPVPMAMIRENVSEVIKKYSITQGVNVLIFAPQGKEIAKKTFNPRLGIEGGISILGTSGIVEPMSEAALIESIRIEMRQKLQMGEKYLLVTPGNYGADFLREHMELPFEKNMKCSNYVGETIDMAVNMGAKGILFIAHIGKFVKLGVGIMNTHSHSADARMETLCACAIRAGSSLEDAKQILECSTTEEALDVLEQRGLLKETMEILLEKIQFYLDHRSYERICLGAVLFSSEKGYLGKTRDAEFLIGKFAEEIE